MSAPTVIRNYLQGLTLLVALFFAAGLHAQVTTSAISGEIGVSGGSPVAGATVTAVHTPTNTSFTAVTNSLGRFSLTGIPVGGPYRVSATASGFDVAAVGDVLTTLGESTEVLLVATASNVVRMAAMEVVGSVSDLDGEATGAGTVLNERRILAQPTVQRSFSDLVRTNPFVSIRAGQQIQALGMNNRYNSILLDGAKINDSFGIPSSGLFSLNNPFSVDAIEQFSVSLTPYDIRQSGFAGASVNAVSKSGTNQFHGTGYFLYTDKRRQGADLFGTNKGIRLPLKERTYGFTFGGPILRDRLFFFVNLEKYYRDSAPPSPAFTPSAAFLSAIETRAAALPGAPKFGSFGGASVSRLADTKRLLKLDWNIIANHRLSVRFSDTVGAQPNTSSINGTSFSQPATITGQPTSFPNGVTGLPSNFYYLAVEEKVWAAQLFSSWTPAFRTQFSYSSTKQDSERATPIKFPEIRIFDVPGTSSSGAAISTGNALRFGTGISEHGNQLNVTTRLMSGSADYERNAFTFTAGVDREDSEYLNLFRQGSYGVFNYRTLLDFQNDTPFAFLRSVVQTGVPAADISEFGQTGYFGQVKWTPLPRLNLIGGIRVDQLDSPIAPAENAAFRTAFGITNSGTIDATVPAPRFSFNYAFDRERTRQLRGGYGVFLGRNPWVWISNSFGNTGVGRFNVNLTSGFPTLTQYLNGSFSNTDPSFKFDPANPIGSTSVTGTASAINLVRPGLKPPTIQRGNLAFDQKLPFLDAIATLEYISTVQQSALFVDNINLRSTVLGADGRQRFAGTSTSAPLVAGFGNVIRTRDIKAGKSQYWSIALDRPFKDGWAANFAYTRGHATEAQSLNSSTANSQWQFNGVFNQNTVEIGRSDYEIRDRVQFTYSREFSLFRNLPTTVSLYYEGRTGMPFSYVYGNDLNGDGFSTDLVAVPSSPTDPRFDFSGMTSAQRDAYFAFLTSSGLSNYAGSYAPRNAFLTPWQNRLDLRLSQEVPVFRQAKLEVFADFINFGTWLSKSFFNPIDLLNTSATNGGQGRLLGNASYTSTAAGALIRPTVTLNASNEVSFGSTSLIVPNNGESRWRIQAGARLKF